jgi:hypothetical protein
VHRNADLVRERPIIQHVDAVEQRSDEHPSLDGYAGFPHGIWPGWVALREVGA